MELSHTDTWLFPRAGSTISETWIVVLERRFHLHEMWLVIYFVVHMYILQKRFTTVAVLGAENCCWIKDNLKNQTKHEYRTSSILHVRWWELVNFTDKTASNKYKVCNRGLAALQQHKYHTQGRKRKPYLKKHASWQIIVSSASKNWCSSMTFVCLIQWTPLPHLQYNQLSVWSGVRFIGHSAGSVNTFGVQFQALYWLWCNC